jgi:hypothetical protein
MDVDCIIINAVMIISYYFLCLSRPSDVGNNSDKNTYIYHNINKNNNYITVGENNTISKKQKIRKSWHLTA